MIEAAAHTAAGTWLTHDQVSRMYELKLNALGEFVNFDRAAILQHIHAKNVAELLVVGPVGRTKRPAGWRPDRSQPGGSRCVRGSLYHHRWQVRRQGGRQVPCHERLGCDGVRSFGSRGTLLGCRRRCRGQGSECPRGRRLGSGRQPQGSTHPATGHNQCKAGSRPRPRVRLHRGARADGPQASGRGLEERDRSHGAALGSCQSLQGVLADDWRTSTVQF